MSALTRMFRKRRKQQAREPESKLYQIVSNIAIVGIFIAVALLVLAVFKIFKTNTFMFGLIATIALLSIGCLMLLPWLKNFEKGINKKTSIVFMCFVIICTALWIICVFLILNLYSKSQADASNTSLAGMLKFLKITLIISLQFMMSSLIASTIIKYKNKMIFFQAITYLSNLYFDFYVTFFLCCLTITPNEGLEIANSIKFLFNKLILVLFVLSIIYMFISSSIMKSVEAKRFKSAVEDNYEIDGTTKSNSNSQLETSPEQKLEKLKNLLDKNLITQEEYDKKKENILKDM